MTEERKVKPFEIIVGEAGGEIMNGDVPVRWCITPELVKDMEDAGINDPHILLISYRKGTDREMDRKLVPLTELMTYVRFSAAGEQTLASWIVSSGAHKNRVALKNEFLKKDRDYTEYYHAEDGLRVRPETTITDFSYQHSHITVDIPAGAFAKEPPAWLKWFGNLWHENRVIDQCNFRRRLMLAFGLKWIPMLAWIVISTVIQLGIALVLNICGWVKAPQYKQIFHPFDGGVSYCIDGDSMTIDPHPFMFRYNWDPDYQFQNRQTFILFMPFVPIVPLVVALVSLLVAGPATMIVPFIAIMTIIVSLAILWDAISALINYLQTSHIGTRLHDRWHNFDTYMVDKNAWPNTIMLTIVAVIVGFFYLLATSFVFQMLLGIIFCAYLFVTGTFKLGEWMLRNDIQKNDYTQIRELLCPRDPLNLEAKYDLIPRKQRTTRLWVAKIKNKICKPMQY